MKPKIINIVECNEGVPSAVHSFIIEKAADEKEAEELFRKITKENGLGDSEFDFCFNRGYFSTGDYTVAHIISE